MCLLGRKVGSRAGWSWEADAWSMVAQAYVDIGASGSLWNVAHLKPYHLQLYVNILVNILLRRTLLRNIKRRDHNYHPYHHCDSLFCNFSLTHCFADTFKVAWLLDWWVTRENGAKQRGYHSILYFPFLTTGKHINPSLKMKFLNSGRNYHIHLFIIFNHDFTKNIKMLSYYVSIQ